MMKKVISLVGARPQFIKEAVVGAEARKRNHWNHILVHSGQHYDVNMSEIFFEELDIKKPDYFLGVGSGRHGEQTAEVLAKFESILIEEYPDCVLVYGDTNTTIAGALAAAKMKIPVVHIEAGIRQQPKDMPEEINRVLTDHVSKTMFCCSQLAARNLNAEGITEQVFVVGDVMFDLFRKMQHRFNPEKARRKLDYEKGEYLIATLHRDFNVDDRENLAGILEGLAKIRRETGMRVCFPAHPRTKKRITDFNLDEMCGAFDLVEPMGYCELMSLTQDCAAVVTDSGGYQKEAYFAGKRAVVLMPDTGWRELVELGWSHLCPPESERLKENVLKALSPAPVPASPYGDGNAGHAIVTQMQKLLSVS